MISNGEISEELREARKRCNMLAQAEARGAQIVGPALLEIAAAINLQTEAQSSYLDLILIALQEIPSRFR